jgi:hypothetical protein
MESRIAESDIVNVAQSGSAFFMGGNKRRFVARRGRTMNKQQYKMVKLPVCLLGLITKKPLTRPD